MTIIKRLHIFMLKTFLPLFAMTFFIVLFIVLMQFLWKYIDDLVGKGLSFSVLGELFFYAAVSMVPMALPLAILLASLMTFGNLGEKFELTAMKASGISLIRVMAPLIVTVAGISVGAFFFQNDILPKAQVKMWTLLFSMRQKSPELEIPEGVFYDQIPGYNLFVREKNRDNGRLYDIMIYDVSRGGDNASVITSDSAVMAMTPDMKHLYLRLWKGEQFENLRDQTTGNFNNVPFRRETFRDKEVLIPFDANFNRLDEDGMRRQYVGKNIAELHHTMDSLNTRIDSIGRIYAVDLEQSTFASINPDNYSASRRNEEVSAKKSAWEDAPTVSLDTLLARLAPSQRIEVYNNAVSISERRQAELNFRSENMADEKKLYRRHEIELIKKYTLSVACLIFFFIGAPLGAIIRKGGIGTPLVISVLLFLFYYIIDNSGYKMARDGHIDVWLGMWLSTFILAPLGLYVTWKAMNDSSVFDKDRYVSLLRHIFGARQHRKVEYKEVIINETDTAKAEQMLAELRQESLRMVRRLRRRPNYIAYCLRGVGARGLHTLSVHLEETVSYLSNSRNVLVVNRLTDYPVLRHLWIYHPFNKKWLSWAAIIVFPVGLSLWLAGMRASRILRSDCEGIASRSAGIIDLLNEAHKESGRSHE